MKPKYVLRFFYDYGTTPLWGGNQASYEDLGYGYYNLEKFQISLETIERADELSEQFYQSLNWDSPLDPGPLRQAECDKFNRDVKELFETIKKELGPDYELEWHQSVLKEDPELDEYLKNPKEFRRNIIVN